MKEEDGDDGDDDDEEEKDQTPDYTTGVSDAVAVASPRANYLLGSTFLGGKAPVTCGAW